MGIKIPLFIVAILVFLLNFLPLFPDAIASYLKFLLLPVPLLHNIVGCITGRFAIRMYQKDSLLYGIHLIIYLLSIMMTIIYVPVLIAYIMYQWFGSFRQP
jgi:cobalamin biosynthesis protein CobD/CbiB